MSETCLKPVLDMFALPEQWRSESCLSKDSVSRMPECQRRQDCSVIMEILPDLRRIFRKIYVG